MSDSKEFTYASVIYRDTSDRHRSNMLEYFSLLTRLQYQVVYLFKFS